MHGVPGCTASILLFAEIHAHVRMNFIAPELSEGCGRSDLVPLKNPGVSFQCLAQRADLRLNPRGSLTSALVSEDESESCRANSAYGPIRDEYLDESI